MKIPHCVGRKFPTPDYQKPPSAAAVALAYGPRGFDEDRVKGPASKDPEIIAQLAGHSEKTSQTEMLVAALTVASTALSMASPRH